MAESVYGVNRPDFGAFPGAVPEFRAGNVGRDTNALSSCRKQCLKNL